MKDSVFDLIDQNETLKVKLTRKEVIGEDWLVNVVRDVMLEIGRDWHHKVAGDVLLTGGATWQVQMESDVSVKSGRPTPASTSTGATALEVGRRHRIAERRRLRPEGRRRLAAGSHRQGLGQGRRRRGAARCAAVKIKANGEIVIEGAQGIKLVCGSSVIALTTSGIDIAGGTALNINCGGGGGSAGSADSAPDAEPKEAGRSRRGRSLAATRLRPTTTTSSSPIRWRRGAGS